MNDITVEELKERMDRGESLHIIDVREPHEYEEFNIGAKLIPLGTLPDAAAGMDVLKNEEIILHCRSGARSGNAKLYLQELGFSKVRNLLGGMLAWRERYSD
jgi:rhodanese-related sulfurtransferase